MLEDTLIVELLVQYKYALVVPLVFVAQTAVGLAGGFLASLGHLDPFLLWGVLVASAFLHDVIIYVAAYHWGDRVMQVCGPYVSLTQERVDGVKVFFARHCTPILFTSKITGAFGFSLAVLFTAGLSRVPFWHYIAVGMLGEALWSGLLVSVGYFFGAMYVAVESALARASLVVAFVAIVVMAVGFGRHLHARLRRQWQKENQ